MLYVICLILYIICYMLYILYYILYIIYHILYIIYFIFYIIYDIIYYIIYMIEIYNLMCIYIYTSGIIFVEPQVCPSDSHLVAALRWTINSSMVVRNSGFPAANFGNVMAGSSETTRRFAQDFLVLKIGYPQYGLSSCSRKKNGLFMSIPYFQPIYWDMKLQNGG
jgi:hypothetical protein